MNVFANSNLPSRIKCKATVVLRTFSLLAKTSGLLAIVMSFFHFYTQALRKQHKQKRSIRSIIRIDFFIPCLLFSHNVLLLSVILCEILKFSL